MPMKTAVSVPDDLFERAERLARRDGYTRSGLYAKALEEFIDRQSPPKRGFGQWTGKVTIADDADIVGSDPDVLAMFED